MEQTTAKRMPALDNIKGILIILVVFAHCLFDFQGRPLINLLTDTIYVFHMPAFIFFTGYLSQSKHARGGEALTRLFGAYLFFNTVLLLVHFAFNDHAPMLLTPYNSYWYILAVLAWRLIVERISKIRGALVFCTLLAIAAGCYGELSNLLAISRIVTFFPFFLAGYLLPKEKLRDLIEKRGAKEIIKGVLLTAVSLTLAALLVQRNKLTDDELQMFQYDDAVQAISRVGIFAVSTLVILGLLLCVPNRKVPLLTMIGRNSLSIFLLHRIPTLALALVLDGPSQWLVLGASVGLTAVLTIGFGAEPVAKAIGRLLDFLCGLLYGNSKSKHAACGRVCMLITAFAVCSYDPVIAVQQSIEVRREEDEDEVEESTDSASFDEVYPQLSRAEQEEFADDATLLFAGDLILLEDQVKRAYQNDTYDFNDLFAYTKKYISDADLAIGVFEGPMAGAAAGYSTSNYDDGKTLALNFPDTFADAVQAAGFDLVTTANNHLLDKSVEGAMRTLDVLDKIGLDHTGSYRDETEKNRVKVVDCGGLRVAVLAYTFGTNGYGEGGFFNDDFSNLTAVTADPNGTFFETAKEHIAADFARAKAEKPDLIVALPHMGEQFLEAPDSYQTTWNELFLSYGADVVLNDHTHSVQPVELREADGKTKLIVNCPGNYANIYREHDGDATAMVEVYIDKTAKSVTGAAVIPMWTQAPLAGNYRALPIYDILHNDVLRREISTYELERVEEVQRHVTRVMLGAEIPCNAAEERYFLTQNGYAAQPCEPLTLTDADKESVLYQKLSAAERVCFVGDSVTEGCGNGGFGWYRPLEKFCKASCEQAKGGGTTKLILPKVEADASYYVVALGTNDVRYRDAEICAMTAEAYITEYENFVTRIRETRPDADFAFVAPWMALENDTVSALEPSERDPMLAEYAEALQTWCQAQGFVYADPNPAIRQVLATCPDTDYMANFIHPNRGAGIALYARAVLAAAHG